MVLLLQRPSTIEFDFNSGRASPCGSSPSTPKGFGDFYLSAPTTPAHMLSTCALSYAFPFKTNAETQSPSKSINKLEAVNSPLLSPNSTKSAHKKSFWSTFSPKSDHYKTRDSMETETKKKGRGRGRGRVSDISNSRDGRRVIRSLSPPRESKYTSWEEEEEEEEEKSGQNTTSTSSAQTLSCCQGSRKWRLKDLLLFRSASEGRVSEKDPFKKYSYMHRKHTLPTPSPSTQGSPSRRRGPVSAHEMHYTVNKANSEDMRKKSFLPYKQGILGRLAINPAVHTLAHGFGL